LKLWPYKITVVHALKEHDPVARINFCISFLRSIHDGKVDPQLVFFPNEAWFSLHEEVNAQNNQYWSAQNPRLIHELPLHDEKIGWCAISACRIIDNALNGVGYVNNILSSFFCQANRRRKAIWCFPARFCNSSYGTCKFGSTVGGS
jgi:hypothetical protein